MYAMEPIFYGRLKRLGLTLELLMQNINNLYDGNEYLLENLDTLIECDIQAPIKYTIPTHGDHRGLLMTENSRSMIHFDEQWREALFYPRWSSIQVPHLPLLIATSRPNQSKQLQFVVKHYDELVSRYVLQFNTSKERVERFLDQILFGDNITRLLCRDPRICRDALCLKLLDECNILHQSCDFRLVLNQQITLVMKSVMEYLQMHKLLMACYNLPCIAFHEGRVDFLNDLWTKLSIQDQQKHLNGLREHVYEKLGIDLPFEYLPYQQSALMPLVETIIEKRVRGIKDSKALEAMIQNVHSKIGNECIERELFTYRNGKRLRKVYEEDFHKYTLHKTNQEVKKSKLSLIESYYKYYSK